MSRLLCAALLSVSVGRIEALLASSRLPASRIAAVHCTRSLPLFMCDGVEDMPEVAAPVTEAAAEPVVAAEAAEEETPRRRPQRESRMSIDELTVGSTVEGTVRSVQSYGAFVNIGASTDGLLHVSEMADTFVKDATEMFKVGDKVSVRIKNVNTEKGQVALSCKSEDAESAPRRAPRKARPDMSEFASADPKVFVTGTVSSITTFGAFVTIKEGVDGLVHISAISEERCERVEDVLSEGQEVQVRVVSFDAEKRRLGLSMRQWTEASAEDEKPRGRGRGGGRGRDFFDDDSEYKLSDSELADLGVDFDGEEEEVSVFAQAFARAEQVQKAKASKQKFAPQLL
uniref:S1 motif domain-containing protein n=1 Tax=Coccolithus braarudii TaxID=221442 RepID=A0A7S0Q8J4_9EUKA|mmetsp:Transcript_48721/g.104006  ORF Transcript_48721/g.104006 Transcript_48721/m.104006 type:complete len:343 (+) Transcript_48721:38-1066(+)|eukprot:CAMPEP_0183350822 /NCGR_PEP_ID=MMETSP0164_2-20130417/21069_1 /TAXON_ID=221442 /ORGANISM="Coccolithus pelagicus ssp braarudi, Strain PLY182g" /LENGTH=342 /DNA_ID=CAMNT_0025522821 /DNA_START=35 /DNA_END=1063 /DNA_ORIENTATION=+